MENDSFIDSGLMAEKTDQAIDDISKAFHKVYEDFYGCFVAYLNNHVNSIGFYSYPNKRVIHLALHHPKARVRKKNTKRILNWILQEHEQKDG